MSAALVKKSLEIFAAQESKKEEKKKKRKSVPNPKDLLPTNRHGLKKHKRRLEQPKKNTGKIQKSFSRSGTIDQLRQKLLFQDKTEENIKRFQLLNQCKLVGELTNKILSKIGAHRETDPEPKEECGTVFMEEDFEKFEREYFVS